MGSHDLCASVCVRELVRVRACVCSSVCCTGTEVPKHIADETLS